MRLPLVRGTRVDNIGQWRDSLPLNMTAFSQQVGEYSGYMRTAEGLKEFTLAEGEDRGGIWSDRFKTHLRVSGDKLIEVSQFGAVTDVGAPTTIAGTGQVQFANSFNSVAFVANGEYYRYDPSAGTLTLISKPVGAGYYVDIVWIDGYYILTDNENLWATDIADETTISAIKFAGSDFAPDEIVGLGRSTDNKLMAFNRYNTERFYNAAGPQFPFARIPNAAIPIGIVGPKAKASIGDGMWAVFGGSKEYSPGFYILTNSFQSIGTKEIDSIIDTYSDYELFNMVIEFRDTSDQSLVICHLPRDVLVYDLTMSKAAGSPVWYTWTSADKPWRAINGVYDPRNIDNSASGWIYGDKDDNKLGKLDNSISSQYGVDVEWECRTPIVRVGGTVAEMEVQNTSGHTELTPNRIFVSTTKDGVLYGPEALVNAGLQGQYQHRVIARRLGDYPNWFGLKLRGNGSEVVTLTGCEIK
jgi:hypothetical protein